MKFPEFAYDFVEKRYKTPSTKTRCDFTVLDFSNFLASRGDIPLKDITEKVLIDYIHEKAEVEKRSATGINCELRNLKMIFTHAVKMKIFDQSPMSDIKYLKETKKIVQIPTDGEVRKILLWFQENDIITFPWVYFMATWGWRRDELRHLRVNDLDLAAKKIYIRETKTGVERVHDLQEQDVMILAEHFHQLKKTKAISPKRACFSKQERKFAGAEQDLRASEVGSEEMRYYKANSPPHFSAQDCNNSA